MTRINVTVDGVVVLRRRRTPHAARPLPARQLGKTGTVVGCDTSNCGACTVHLDGRSVKSCTCSPSRPTATRSPPSRGWPQDGELHPMQQAFHENHALQCGFCTPGMIMQPRRPAQRQPDPDRGRDPRGPRGQPVPLHRLPEHRRGRADRPPGQRARGATVMTAVERPPPSHAEVGAAAPAQGGPAADHRPHPVDRQHRAAGHAAPRHACAARSPTPRITSIDTAAAKALAERRRACYTGADLDDEQGSLPCAWPITAGHGDARATRRSRSTRSHFAGEIVAVVVARTAAEARDAAELVDVDYDELPVGARHGGGGRPDGADLVHPDLGTNKSAPPGSSTPPRPAPAATSTRRSPRPARTAS